MSRITAEHIERARKIARECYGAGVQIETLPLTNHILLRLRLSDGDRIMKFASYARGSEAMRKEVSLICSLAAAGIPVPVLDGAHVESTAHSLPFIVMEVAGSTTVMDWARETGQLPGLLFAEMGSVLARIHGVPPEHWKKHETLVESRDPTEFLSEVYEFASSLARGGLLDSADLELHKQLVLPKTIGTSICHADFHAPQCIVHQGRISAVVDWESAWVGNPMIDLAFSHAYLDYYCMAQGSRALARAAALRDSFFEGYKAVRALPSDYGTAYLPIRMAHVLGVMRTWHGWGAQVWQRALEDRVPRAAALYGAYARKARKTIARTSC